MEWSSDVTGRVNIVQFLFFFLEILGGKTDSGFPKTFSGDTGISVFVEYFCNLCPEVRTKNFKNYILILAVGNYRNWLDAS